MPGISINMFFFVQSCLFDWSKSKANAKKTQQNSYFRYILFLHFALINDQWNAFFSSSCVNYVSMNFVCAKGCTA